MYVHEGMRLREGGTELRSACFYVLIRLLASVLISALVFYPHKISNLNDRRVLGRHRDAGFLIFVVLMFGMNIQMQKNTF